MERTELRTERLLLCPFHSNDVDDVLAYASDPEWARYLLPAPQPYTRLDAEEFVAREILVDWGRRPSFALVMEGKVIGGVTLRVDVTSGVGDLGYALAREHWGKGLTPEATRALIDWGFRTYNLAKIVGRTDGENRRSQRVLEKLGFRREGLLRSHRVLRGERRDEAVYGLLREDWDSLSEKV